MSPSQKNTLIVNKQATRYAELKELTEQTSNQSKWVIDAKDGLYELLYLVADVGKEYNAIFTEKELLEISPDLPALFHAKNLPYMPYYLKQIESLFDVVSKACPVVTRVVTSGSFYKNEGEDVTKKRSTYHVNIHKVLNILEKNVQCEAAVYAVTRRKKEGIPTLAIDRDYGNYYLLIDDLERAYPGFVAAAQIAKSLGLNSEQVATHVMNACSKEKLDVAPTLPTLDA